MDTQLTVGSPAPDFALVSTYGQIRLSDYQGRQNVVLFFMREFNCATCRQHVNHLKRLYDTFQARDTTVLVIGGGQKKDAEKLAHTFSTPFPVLADPDRSVYLRYSLDKVVMFVQRSGTMVVDKQGTLRYMQQAMLPTAALEAEAVLRVIKSLQTAPLTVE